jgi:hypothetical protein
LSSIEATLDAQRALRVTFVREADRYRHEVALVERTEDGSEQVTPLLASVEGTAADAWPSSPPLQSLSIEQRPEGNVALLVGMAGRSHWSASIEALSAEGALRFDIACRTTDAQRLASMYQRLSDRLRCEPGAGTKIVEAETLQLSPQELQARPARWRYVLRLA